MGMLKVSFFSYKGGAGRTSMLYNTVSYIAQKLRATPENPIVVIDFDIDSKGLSYLLKSGKDESSYANAIQLLKRSGVLFDGNSTAEEFFGAMMPVGSLFGLGRAADKSVLFITANSRDQLNGNNNFDAGGIDLNRFVKRLDRFGCKALIMDNPAGGQLSSDVALRISDVVVTVMRITKQFREGTKEFLEKEKNFSNRKYIIVPNAVPSAEGTEYSIKRIMDNIAGDLKYAGESTQSEVDTTLVEQGGVGEVVLFKFEETNLMFREKIEGKALQPDERLAAEKYELLSEVICNGADE